MLFICPCRESLVNPVLVLYPSSSCVPSVVAVIVAAVTRGVHSV